MPGPPLSSGAGDGRARGPGVDVMAQQQVTGAGQCPAWCGNDTDTGTLHAHLSADLVVGDEADPVVVRMLQLAGSERVRVVVGQQVLDVEQTEVLAHALLGLVASARLADPGLGFVETLLEQSGASLGELALASGLEVDRLRAQRAGGRLLNRSELDRLALAAAGLLLHGRGETAPDEPSEGDDAPSVSEDRPAAPETWRSTEYADLVDVADLHQLAAMSAERS